MYSLCVCGRKFVCDQSTNQPIKPTLLHQVLTNTSNLHLYPHNRQYHTPLVPPQPIISYPTCTPTTDNIIPHYHNTPIYHHVTIPLFYYPLSTSRYHKEGSGLGLSSDELSNDPNWITVRNATELLLYVYLNVYVYVYVYLYVYVYVYLCLRFKGVLLYTGGENL